MLNRDTVVQKHTNYLQVLSGTSSVGRARPCQGRGHEFEPRVPLQFILKANPDTGAEWQSGHAPDCKSVYLGSTPGSASIQHSTCFK
ncbi:hypothetical protein LCGC14_2431530 [marine sediment metagenome]|uniref:Uncharacterized protein n=1 Tax=marine sediment metagenome TaxID=412755 RepID=A0A0F9C965_9ZZZZ